MRPYSPIAELHKHNLIRFLYKLGIKSAKQRARHPYAYINDEEEE